jgi:rhodanese-related sulfurtransferase
MFQHYWSTRIRLTKKIWIAVFCLVWAGAAFAKPPPVVAELIANAKASVHTIDMKAFHTLLQKPDHGLIIDVREPDEYASGHVEGAVNIPRGMIEFRIWQQIGYPKTTPADVKLTLYCKSSGRSALAAKSLKELGFVKVTTVDMNIKDWVDAGYPLTEPEL